MRKKYCIILLFIPVFLVRCSSLEDTNVSPAEQVVSTAEYSEDETNGMEQETMTAVLGLEDLTTDFNIIDTLTIEDILPGLTKESWDIKDLYTRNINSFTSYYIDNEQVLWAYGDNFYGQIGNGEQNRGGYVEKPYRVAQNVMHVSFSGEYFAAFVTEDHKLYGMGANLNGIMNMEPDENYQMNPWYTVSTSPTLLMEDVIYAICSYKALIALKDDKSVWILGGETAFVLTPQKVLDHAKLIVSGHWVSGAITEDDSLWIWGDNRVGQCGVGYFVETIYKPQKVAENATMCWFPNQIHKTIMKKQDGSLWVCGKDIGNDITSPLVWGDMFGDFELECSLKFIPLVLDIAEDIYEKP